MINIDKIVCNDGEIVKELNMVTNRLVIFNLEQLDDGTIIDGKFSIPKYVNFLGHDNQLISWEKLVEETLFVWNNQEFEIKNCEDPQVTRELNLIISQLPLFQDLDKN